MRIISFTLFALSFFISDLAFGQSIEDRYEFFNKHVLNNRTSEIISRNGSSDVYEIFIDKESGFEHEHCMFIDNKYYNEAIWDSILTDSDTKYFYKQINEYKNFKWNAEKLPANIVLYSKWKGKRYSRKVMRYFNGKADNNDFKIQIINHYSLPIFNLNKNFALVYYGSYSSPESAHTSVDIYLKIDGKWKRIGTYLDSMS